MTDGSFSDLYVFGEKPQEKSGKEYPGLNGKWEQEGIGLGLTKKRCI